MTVKTPKPLHAAKPDGSIDHRDGGHTLVGVKLAAAQPKRMRVKVGGVYVTGDKASAAQLKRSVATSADMLERLEHKIAQPGVRLKAARNIPLFFVDPRRPGRFLRKLDGKIEGGVLQNGDFKVLD